MYGIIQQSGGHICVYSEPQRGATFKTYLPRSIETTVAVLGECQPANTGRGNETILLVEDDQEVRQLAYSVLKAHGYSVLVPENALSVVPLCEQHKSAIHLLVTDVVMPGMNGRELAKQVAARRPNICVLYMSGYADSAVFHDGVLDVGTFFLEKPFTPSSLANKLRDVLDSHRINHAQSSIAHDEALLADQRPKICDASQTERTNSMH